MNNQKELNEEEYNEERCPICNNKMATNNRFCSLKCYEEFRKK